MTLKYSVFPEDNVVLDHFALKALHKEIFYKSIEKLKKKEQLLAL